MNPVLSIIVPVYKTEDYLGACIESILSQSFGDFELILVDDGSPDLCCSICDEYASRDKRIRVIHKTNGGLSSARNAGIKIATGQYITFVDSDDKIAPDTYSPNMVILLNNPSIDLLEYPVHVHYNTSNGYIVAGKNLLASGKKSVFGTWIKNKGHYYPYACNKIFKAKLFDNIRFPENRKFEDLLIIIPLLKLCEHIYFSGEGCYLYYRHPTSICNSTPNYNSICDLMDGKMSVLEELLTYDNLNEEMLAFYLYTVDTLINVNRRRGQNDIYYHRLLQELSPVHLSVITLLKLNIPAFKKIKNLPLALFGIRTHCLIYKYIRK